MLGVYEGGRLCYVGNTETGFSESMLKQVYGRLEPYFTDICPFTPRPKANAPVQWVKPPKKLDQCSLIKLVSPKSETAGQSRTRMVSCRNKNPQRFWGTS